MRKICLFLGFLFCFSLFSQNKTFIKGVILDENGYPLKSANISLSVSNKILEQTSSLNDGSFIKFIERLDYLTKYNLKYTCKKIKKRIEDLKLDTILDLRNTKYPNDNNVVYKILLKHKDFLTKVFLKFLGGMERILYLYQCYEISE